MRDEDAKNAAVSELSGTPGRTNADPCALFVRQKIYKRTK